MSDTWKFETAQIHAGQELDGATNAQLTKDEQATAGVSPGLIRLSVGIEHIDDIIADLEKGFAAV